MNRIAWLNRCWMVWGGAAGCTREKADGRSQTVTAVTTQTVRRRPCRPWCLGEIFQIATRLLWLLPPDPISTCHKEVFQREPASLSAHCGKAEMSSHMLFTWLETNTDVSFQKKNSQPSFDLTVISHVHYSKKGVHNWSRLLHSYLTFD